MDFLQRCNCFPNDVTLNTLASDTCIDASVISSEMVGCEWTFFILAGD